MKINELTVSLETAKLLKEANFIGSTFWCWKWKEGIFPYIVLNDLVKGSDYFYANAPTTDELLEELPHFIGANLAGDDNGYLTITKHEDNNHNEKYYMVSYAIHGTRVLRCSRTHESLPEALAQMWLYLKK